MFHETSIHHRALLSNLRRELTGLDMELRGRVSKIDFARSLNRVGVNLNKSIEVDLVDSLALEGYSRDQINYAEFLNEFENTLRNDTAVDDAVLKLRRRIADLVDAGKNINEVTRFYYARCRIFIGHYLILTTSTGIFKTLLSSSFLVDLFGI